MKPTPAQIEAAMGAYGVVLSQALVDGVEVSPDVLRSAMSAALTAAAEVEEHSEVLLGYDVRRNATIERCAQVAEHWLLHYGYPAGAFDIAAAIRALKDK